MRIEIIAFTRLGARLARKLADGLARQGNDCTVSAMPRHAREFGASPLEQTLSQWAATAFSRAEALVFVSACGVAVRAIAPLLQSKAEDPAVIVLDDNGRFAISLLSGHIGGANALTLAAARVVGARPVISTATDGSGVFSVDAWAVQNNCALWELSAAKAISAALLDCKDVGLYIDPLLEKTREGELPAGVKACTSGPLGFSVSLDETLLPFAVTLPIVPRVLALGIGCKRGTTAQAIEAHVQNIFAQNKLSARALCAICSIDLKAEEPGLLEFCAMHGLSLLTYAAQELQATPGSFTSSDFVRDTVGVDNVCERAAVLCAGTGGALLVKKQAANGVTAAVAMREWRLRF